jgi:hypothetical protein
MLNIILKISLIVLLWASFSFARTAGRGELVSFPNIQLVQGESFKKQPINDGGDQDSLERKRSHKRRKKSRGRRAGR